MPMSSDSIIAMIKAALPDATITIDDLAGDNDHFAVTVVSGAFQGKSRVQQHTMVYDALGGRMGGDLHALSIKTMTGN